MGLAFKTHRRPGFAKNKIFRRRNHRFLRVLGLVGRAYAQNMPANSKS